MKSADVMLTIAYQIIKLSEGLYNITDVKVLEQSSTGSTCCVEMKYIIIYNYKSSVFLRHAIVCN